VETVKRLTEKNGKESLQFIVRYVWRCSLVKYAFDKDCSKKMHTHKNQKRESQTKNKRIICTDLESPDHSL
jgi:hypothetical protein